jgi:hypothetical protein
MFYVGSALEDGLTETRAGKINDRGSLFEVVLKGRLNVKGMPTWLEGDGLRHSNRPERPALSLQHDREICADRRIAGGIARCQKDRRDSKQNYNFEPMCHNVVNPSKSLAKVLRLQLQDLIPRKGPVYYFANSTRQGTPHFRMRRRI